MSDSGHLIVTICLGEQYAGLPTNGSDNHPPFGASVVGQRRCVFGKFELQDIDKEMNRFVVVADDQSDEL